MCENPSLVCVLTILNLSSSGDKAEPVTLQIPITDVVDIVRDSPNGMELPKDMEERAYRILTGTGRFKGLRSLDGIVSEGSACWITAGVFCETCKFPTELFWEIGLKQNSKPDLHDPMLRHFRTVVRQNVGYVEYNVITTTLSALCAKLHTASQSVDIVSTADPGIGLN